MKFDAQGRECPDSTPVALPVGTRKPESLQDMMRRMIRNDMSLAAAAMERETFDEANDFEIPEEDAESTSTEYELMAEEVPHAQAKQKVTPSKPRNEDPESEEGSDQTDESDRSDERPRARARKPGQGHAQKRRVPLDDDDDGEVSAARPKSTRRRPAELEDDD